MSTRSVQLRIRGLVQGVSYRASALGVAQELGLVGYVRNLPGGDVEAVATGDAERVDRFIAWARRGPPEAVVEAVNVSDVATPAPFTSFRVLR